MPITVSAMRCGWRGSWPQQSATCSKRWRLLFRPKLPMPQYLALHNEVDMVLDTRPYTGGTTTTTTTTTNHQPPRAVDGGAVITLQVPTRAQCQSASSLKRLGLGDWAAQSKDQFVDLASGWSERLPELSALRADIGARWERAPLRQPALVARGFEAVLEAMWQRWCDGLLPAHLEVGLDEVESGIFDK